MTYATYLFLEKFRGTPGLLKCLGSSYTPNRVSGIENIGSAKDSVRMSRVKKYGANVYSEKQMPSFWALVFNQLGDKLIKLLIAASFLAIIAQYASTKYEHGFLQGFSILFTVMTIVFISAISEYRCQQNLLKFGGDGLSNTSVSVFRESKDPISIPPQELLVGDVICVDKGMIMPADCILIQAGHPRQTSIDDKVRINRTFKCSSEIMLLNEKEITGDDNYKPKMPIDFTTADEYEKAYTSLKRHKELSNVLYAGSIVASGEGVAVVCAVGPNTQLGMFVKSVFQPNNTNVNDEMKISGLLDEYLSKCTNFSYVIISVLFGFMVLNRLLTKKYESIEMNLDYYLNAIIVSFCLLMALVPEALYMTMTKSLGEFTQLKLFKEQKLQF